MAGAGAGAGAWPRLLASLVLAAHLRAVAATLKCHALMRDSKCFFVIDDMHLQWSEAAGACQQEGMELATIFSEEENDEVSFLLKHGKGGGQRGDVCIESAWIGLNDKLVDGSWRWRRIDGEEENEDLTFTKWSNEFGSAEEGDCAGIMGELGWAWIALPCTQRRPAVCSISVDGSEAEAPILLDTPLECSEDLRDELHAGPLPHRRGLQHSDEDHDHDHGDDYGRRRRRGHDSHEDEEDDGPTARRMRRVFFALSVVINVLIWIITPSIMAIFFCYAHAQRQTMLQKARAGQPVEPPSQYWKYCCGFAAVYYWEGCSLNFFITLCIYQGFACICWNPTPFPMENGRQVGQPVQVGTYTSGAAVYGTPVQGQPVQGNVVK